MIRGRVFGSDAQLRGCVHANNTSHGIAAVRENGPMLATWPGPVGRIAHRQAARFIIQINATSRHGILLHTHRNIIYCNIIYCMLTQTPHNMNIYVSHLSNGNSLRVI